MAQAITIDGVGRLVIPKHVRQRLHLVAGTQLHLTEEDGRIILSPDRPTATLVERDGFLAIDPEGSLDPGAVDHRGARDERAARLVEFAMLRR